MAEYVEGRPAAEPTSGVAQSSDDDSLIRYLCPLNIAILGSKGSGKSSISGLLLLLTGSIDDITRENQKKLWSPNHRGSSPPPAWFSDTTNQNRKFGETRHLNIHTLSLKTRSNAKVIDFPGHNTQWNQQFSLLQTCDVAILVIDSCTSPSATAQIHMQVSLAHLYGVREWIICVNHMDSLETKRSGKSTARDPWDETNFSSFASFARDMLQQAGYSTNQILGCVPTSCHDGGVNILSRNNKKAPWYDGQSLIELLESSKAHRPMPPPAVLFATLQITRVLEHGSFALGLGLWKSDGAFRPSVMGFCQPADYNYRFPLQDLRFDLNSSNPFAPVIDRGNPFSVHPSHTEAQLCISRSQMIRAKVTLSRRVLGIREEPILGGSLTLVFPFSSCMALVLDLEENSKTNETEIVACLNGPVPFFAGSMDATTSMSLSKVLLMDSIGVVGRGCVTQEHPDRHPTLSCVKHTDGHHSILGPVGPGTINHSNFSASLNINTPKLYSKDLFQGRLQTDNPACVVFDFQTNFLSAPELVELMDYVKNGGTAVIGFNQKQQNLILDNFGLCLVVNDPKRRIINRGRGLYAFERPREFVFKSPGRSERQYLRRLRHLVTYAVQRSDGAPRPRLMSPNSSTAEQECWLPDDVWTHIMKFASTSDIEAPFSMMFTSKQLYSVAVKNLARVFPSSLMKNTSILYCTPNVKLAEHQLKKTPNQIRVAALTSYIRYTKRQGGVLLDGPFGCDRTLTTSNGLYLGFHIENPQLFAELGGQVLCSRPEVTKTPKVPIMIHFPRFVNGRLGQIILLARSEMPDSCWKNLFLDTLGFQNF